MGRKKIKIEKADRKRGRKEMRDDGRKEDER